MISLLRQGFPGLLSREFLRVGLAQDPSATVSLDLPVKIFVRSDEHGVVVSGEGNISRIIESYSQLPRDLEGLL